jgi:intracellular sulfur oxidation DsrE/DsrF family protein
MRNYVTSRIGVALLVIGATGFFSPSLAEPYQSLKGVEGLKITYDVRLNSPKKAALFLKLIHRTYKASGLESLSRAPEFVVVFNGESVTLISEDHDRFPREARAYLEEIAERIKSMEAEGIRMEACLTAAEIFSVDPKLFHDEIHGIDNAWISISGYQAQEFSIIPVY